MPRLSHTQALLEPELFSKVRDTPVLVVGAGGIGCELLKNLVLVGFANIEIIDLDTIDLSNLNRQFLFRKPDISKPKALVAAASASHFNPSSGIKIHPRHGNVKDAANDLEWISKFGLVMNALDNMDARRHVNKLCQAAGVPLIESGTAGYLGQVSVILRDWTECFDCIPKPAPKSFPVCTIRATPSEPIHCIVWAKTYLFGQLFGEDDEAIDTEELDKAQANGENAEEIANLKKEAAAFREVRRNLGEADGPVRVFHKVFNEDINRLLAMDDMWRVAGRVKPVPLDHDSIMDGTFVTPPLRTSSTAQLNGSNTSNNASMANGSTSDGNQTKQHLEDHKELGIKDNLEKFIASCRRLSTRAISHPNIVLAFDKDDDDTLDFVLATANLRAMAYGIPTKTRFQVKEMAGNIIPAIATTNAIIAGLIVMQAMNLLSRDYTKMTNPYLRADPSKVLGTFIPRPPDPQCAVCRDVYVPFKIDTARITLQAFVKDVVQSWLVKGLDKANGKLNRHPNGDMNGNGQMGGDANGDDEDDGEEVEWAIYEGSRILADPDFDDNYEKTLEELGVERGKMLTVRDEDEVYRPVHFCICEIDDVSSSSYILPSTPPSIPRRPTPPTAESRDSSPDEVEEVGAVSAVTQPLTSISAMARKRAAPEDGDVSIGEDPLKKRKIGDDGKEVVGDGSQGVDDEETQLIE